MAKTIDKLAREYATLPMDVGKGRVCIDRKQKNAFEDGANAVLEEIESCWDWKSKDNRLIVPAEVVLHKIEAKIMELKGE